MRWTSKLAKILAHPLTRGLSVDNPKTTVLRRQIIREKKFLKSIYKEWYATLKVTLPAEKGGVVEIGLYVLKEHKVEFQQYYSCLTNFNYSLLNAKNGREINLQNFNSQIPARTTTDIIAVPPDDSI